MGKQQQYIAEWHHSVTSKKKLQATKFLIKFFIGIIVQFYRIINLESSTPTLTTFSKKDTIPYSHQHQQ